MVTLVNKFTVTGDDNEFRRVLSEISAYMRDQPGYLDHQLLRSLRRPDVYVETAVWADAQSHRNAVQSEEFRERVKQMAGLATPDADLYAEVGETAHS
ncbi:antibiotic biosynthesis monooxygenase [Couchioplanes caeruleus]|uniref:antibiotic biosynthesis monooxygenase family protein n=1 Tax=Couchioplanes caeruleus TaxID=56438 RepID=UPI0020BF925C|nr:antibiotic biosynthesis monooxygenase family protein [Couchioplanes caeruleus]UQU67667.1 antibiotic biosynthesis monooxygenase [Couchioplanes caeruleus]